MRKIACLMLFLAVAGCSDEDRLPNQPEPPGIPDLTIAQLLAAPDTLTTDSLLIYGGEPYLNRDFQPFVGPEGRPMVASVYFKGFPTAATLPSWASDFYLWAIRDSSEVWATKLTANFFDGSRDAYDYTAWGGPYWDPGIQVDVVIGVRTSPTTVSLVLFRDVTIHKSS